MNLKENKQTAPSIYKCKRIKQLLEALSNIPDIGIRSRKGDLPELKKIYCRLCKDFTRASLNDIGSILGNYSHSNVYHSINSFNDLKDTNGLTLYKIYTLAKNHIESEDNTLNKFILENPDLPRTIHEVHQNNRVRVINIIKKSHSVINKLRDKNSSLLQENTDLRLRLKKCLKFSKN